MRQTLINLMARYLRWCARRVLGRAPQGTPIIGITGSTGKTSTKELMGLMVREKLGNSVIVSAGNLNNEIGLPLAILGFAEVPSFWQIPIIKIKALWRALTMNPASAYVLEYGVDHPGDMDFLLSVARPTDAVLTNITPVHLEYFPSLEGLVAEKLKLAAAANTIIINSDDKRFAAADLSNKKVYKFGKADCELQVKNIKLADDTTTFTVKYKGREADFAIGALGEQHVMSALPAILYGYINGYTDEMIRTSILKYKPLPGRGIVIDGAKGSTIIDESYNANPLSVEMTLRVLGKIEKNPKIAVLGDMLELGNKSQEEHKRVLELASDIADLVVTIGPRMKEAGLADRSFLSPQEAGEYLSERVEKGAVVLVKGSQSMRMEFISLRLMRDPSKAAEFLPRQNARWLRTPFKPT